MRFMTGDPEVPILVRLCRNLLLAQAALTLLVALFLLAARGVAAGTVTTEGGLGVGTEAALYALLALVTAVVGINVGRLVAWARWGALALEVALLVFLGEQWLRGRGNGLLLALLCAVVVGILLTPGAGRAFRMAAAERALPHPASPAPDRVEPATPAGLAPGAVPAPPDAVAPPALRGSAESGGSREPGG